MNSFENLVQRVEELENTSSDLQVENYELKQKIQELETTHSILRQEFDASLVNIASSIVPLETRMQKLEELHTNLVKYIGQDNLTEGELERHKLYRRLDELENQVNKSNFEYRIKRLEVSEYDHQRKLESVEAKYNPLKQEVHDLRQDLDNSLPVAPLEPRLASLEELVDDLRAKNSALNTRVHVWEQDIQISEYSKLKKRIDELTQRVNFLSEFTEEIVGAEPEVTGYFSLVECSRKIDELKSLDKKLSDLDARAAKFIAKVYKLESEFQDCLNNGEQESNCLRDKMRKLEDRIASLEQHTATELHSRVDGVEQRVHTLEDRANTFSTLLDNDMTSLSMLKRGLSEVSKRLTEIEKNCLPLPEEEVEKFRSFSDAICQQQMNLITQVATIKRAVKEIPTQIETESMRLCVKKATENQQALFEQIAQLKKEIQEPVDLSDIIGELSNLSACVESLTTQLEEVKAQVRTADCVNRNETRAKIEALTEALSVLNNKVNNDIATLTQNLDTIETGLRHDISTLFLKSGTQSNIGMGNRDGIAYHEKRITQLAEQVASLENCVSDHISAPVNVDLSHIYRDLSNFRQHLQAQINELRGKATPKKGLVWQEVSPFYAKEHYQNWVKKEDSAYEGWIEDEQTGVIHRSLDEYQRVAKKFAKTERHQIPDLAVYALGLAGESGEVVEHVKKHYGHSRELDVHKVILELGDSLYYIAAIAGTLGYGLDYVATCNIEKLSERYPLSERNNEGQQVVRDSSIHESTILECDGTGLASPGTSSDDPPRDWD